MLDQQYEDVTPELKPITDENEKLGLSLKSRETQIQGGKKRCPHCDRVIPEDTRICMECGFDLKKGKTQQERNKKSGSPVKALVAIAVIAGVAAAGYYFKDQIKEFIDSKKDAIEATDGESADFDDSFGDAPATETSADTKVTLDPNFKIEGDPEEMRENLEMEIEDVRSDLEGKGADLKDYEAIYKENVAEYRKAKKSEDKYMAIYNKAKAAKASRSKIESIKERVVEFRDMRKEYETEAKMAKKELTPIKTEVEGLKKKLKASEAKLKQVEAYISNN